ncbi:uncharacterized protein [Spinacia oleracea]|uniref:Uncharacterized protein isoform X2 n=1 Tax=Spinacia oleracea TaxID=3562 RepID=A0A9R0IUK1_SPIOL|nr:uncharacterized protein LOC110795203 isoform X2 [Spinacia oleracea]
MALLPNGFDKLLPISSRMNLIEPPLNCVFPVSTCLRPVIAFRHSSVSFSRVKASSSRRRLDVHSSVSPASENRPWIEFPRAFIKASASSLILVALGIFTFSFSNKVNTRYALAAVDPAGRPTVQEESIDEGRDVQNVDDKQWVEEFENWKSKTYALTVPLRVVALQGSVPPAWIKDFILSQGKRLKLSVQFRGTLEDVFSELSRSLRKVDTSPKSAVTADLISVGDSWLDLMISKSIIEPVQMAEDHDWFKGLAVKWKVFLRRNNEGKIDPEGRIWAVPYRWGSMVIAYKKSKFDTLGLAPIEDWKDLWRPELAGRISMVDSPREVIGAVLKYMGASYNTSDISKEIPGGITAVQQNLALLAKQVLLFDSGNYLKAFSIGDAWVAVGWSSDIIPAARRMSNVAVIAPESGASLWADLWAVPATTRCPPMEKSGGRIRGPSPLIHQWLDFCLQPARELPFKQGVFPGALPSALVNVPSEVIPKGAPKLVTNLISGIPPPEILSKCEFLEPLSEVALSDYERLISSMKKTDHGLLQQIFGSVFHATRMKLLSFEKRNT